MTTPRIQLGCRLFANESGTSNEVQRLEQALSPKATVHLSSSTPFLSGHMYKNNIMFTLAVRSDASYVYVCFGHLVACSFVAGRVVVVVK